MKFWFDKEFEEFLTYTENNKTAIFPISKSICSLWHSGIHLTDGNKPIKNLLSGKIIASSFDEKYKELKLDDYVKKVSGSFILVQHSFNLDKKEYNFYILYAGLLPYENYFFFKDSKYTKKVQSDYSSYSLNKDFPFYLKLKAKIIQGENFHRFGKTGYVGTSINITNKVYSSEITGEYIEWDGDGTESIGLPVNALDFDKNVFLNIEENAALYKTPEYKIGTLKKGTFLKKRTITHNYTKYHVITIKGENINSLDKTGFSFFDKKELGKSYRHPKNNDDIYASLIYWSPTGPSKEQDNLLKEHYKFLKRYWPMTLIEKGPDVDLNFKELIPKTIQYIKKKGIQVILQNFKSKYKNQMESINKLPGSSVLDYSYNVESIINQIDEKKNNIIVYNNKVIEHLPLKEDINENINLFFCVKNENDFCFLGIDWKYIDELKFLEFVAVSEIVNEEFQPLRTMYSQPVKTQKHKSDTYIHANNESLSQKNGIKFFTRENLVPQNESWLFKLIIDSDNKLKSDLPDTCIPTKLYITKAYQLPDCYIEDFYVDSISRNATIKDVSEGDIYRGLRILTGDIQKNAVDENQEIEITEPNKFWQEYIKCFNNSESKYFDWAIKYGNASYGMARFNKQIELDFNIEKDTKQVDISSNSVIGYCSEKFNLQGQNNEYISDVALFMQDGDEKNIKISKDMIEKGTQLYEIKDISGTGTRLYLPNATELKLGTVSVINKDYAELLVSKLKIYIEKSLIDNSEFSKKVIVFKNKKTVNSFYLGYLKFNFDGKEVTGTDVLCDSTSKENFSAENIKLLLPFLTNIFTQPTIKYESYTEYGSSYIFVINCNLISFGESLYVKKDDYKKIITRNGKTNMLQLPLVFTGAELEKEVVLIKTTEEDILITKMDSTVTVKGQSYTFIDSEEKPYYIKSTVPIKNKDILNLSKDFLKLNESSADKTKLYFNYSTVFDVKDSNQNEFLPSDLLKMKTYSDFVATLCDTSTKEKLYKKLAFVSAIHPLEWDKSKYDDDFKKKVKDSIDITNLDAESEAKDLKSKFPASPKEPYLFFHPAVFIEKLEKCNLFEFNPYLLIDSIQTSYNKEIKVKSNPGFVPYENGKYKTTGGYSTNITQVFNNDKKRSDGYIHEGVDIAIERGLCGSVPIKSLINGEIVYSGNQGNDHYGRFIVVKAKNQFSYNNKSYYIYYLLAHLSNDSRIVTSGVVTPGQTVAYVGNTGHCNSKDLSAHDGEIKTRNGVAQNEEYRHLGYGAHLHLEVFRTEENDFKEKFINSKTNPISILARGNPIVNPFNFEEQYTNGGKY